MAIYGYANAIYTSNHIYFCLSFMFVGSSEAITTVDSLINNDLVEINADDRLRALVNRIETCAFTLGAIFAFLFGGFV